MYYKVKELKAKYDKEDAIKLKKWEVESKKASKRLVCVDLTCTQAMVELGKRYFDCQGCEQYPVDPVEEEYQRMISI